MEKNQLGVYILYPLHDAEPLKNLKRSVTPELYWYQYVEYIRGD